MQNETLQSIFKRCVAKALFHLSLIANFSSLILKFGVVAKPIKTSCCWSESSHNSIKACVRSSLSGTKPKWVAGYNLVNCVRTSLKRNAEPSSQDKKNFGKNLYIKILKTDFTYKQKKPQKHDLITKLQGDLASIGQGY